MTNTNEFLKNHQEQLSLYMVAIMRAHGAHHPEVFEVKKHYEQLAATLSENDSADLRPIFEELRQITKNYEVPADVCPTFAAVYQLLAQADYLQQN